MASRSTTQSSLLIDRPPETPLTIQLHPLVLLTISDYITRHTLRKQTGPIAGAVIGLQNGRHVTLEHAYELIVSMDGQIDPSFFQTRLEQYKEVHKAPQLDLVALFMLGPQDGPQTGHLPVLQQVQKLAGSENLLLLLLHPEMVDQEGDKLPVSLYEPVEVPTGSEAQLRFVDRPFEVETGEAEMIGVDFVAKGSGNASAIAGAAGDAKDKKKGKSKSKDEEDIVGANVLSVEDDELISALTAKSNAIKMLDSRLSLLRAYLSSLPASSLTDAENTNPPAADTNFALLRNINAMLSRLPLLAPNSSPSQSQATTIEQASLGQRQDVHVTALLASLTQTVADAQVLGARFSEVQREKTSKERNTFGRGAHAEVDSGKL